jgi:hypothetical protein
MSFAYLDHPAIQELVDAAVAGGLLAQPRALLFEGIAQTFVAMLPLDPAPLVQLRLDLHRLNGVERLAGGTVPLALYFRNAASLIRDLPQADVFKKYHSAVQIRSAGLSGLAAAAQLPAAAIAKEAIIHQDDTVDRRFLEGCLEASRRVAKLSVPRFDNGVQKFVNGGPWIFNGTGWLIGADLLITNHHVIHSRRDDEAMASPADFNSQGEKAEIAFDFDQPCARLETFTSAQVVASDPGLDFCILRLPANAGRGRLSIASDIVKITATTYLPVNIIQHPNGKPKRYALRNNLAIDADQDLLRYYSDTDYGSSGSPVMDDGWRVLALHRGAVFQKANFQGKDTAFVNVGSQIARIMERVKQSDPKLYRELTT